MTSTISSLSSADIQSQLTTDESRMDAPINALNAQSTTDKADITAWGAIKGKVSSLSSALAGINDLSTLNSLAATSTSSSVAKATVANSAAVGTYNLTDVKLAKAQIIYSGVIPTGTNVGASAGSLQFVQNGHTISVHVGSASLSASGVKKAIDAKDDGIEASVVNTQGGARLVLQSSATGSSQAFTVSGTGGLARFSYTPSVVGGSFTSTSSATNASAKINGVPVSHSTNTVSSAVTGLTITLAGAGSATIKVSNSPGGLSTAFSTVATTLNAAIAGINNEIKYTPATKSASASGSTTATAGPLIGNFTATNLESQLLQAVSGAYASGISATSIGLTVSSAGAVSFTSSKFESAYESNPTAVEKLISNIYTTLKDITSGALGSADSSTGGTIGSQTSALDSDVTSIASQVATITKDNNDALNILVKEYSTAEATAQNASITEDYLSLITNASSASSS